MFIWDTDVAAIIQRAVTGAVTGIFNVAGDGAMTVGRDRRGPRQRHADRSPSRCSARRWRSARGWALTAYGPEQTKFLQYRPVLDNTRLKEVFGYTPAYTSERGLRGVETGAS